MEDNQTLKLRLVFSGLGIVMLAVVLFYLIIYDLSKDYPVYISPGSICLIVIIFALINGYILRDVKLLRNDSTQTIFRGLDVIQTVSVGLIFLLATIVGSIFWRHIIIPLVGISLVAFSIRHGLRFMVFDYSTRTVDGLIGDRKITFDNLQIISANEQMMQVKLLDTGETVVLNRETCTVRRWTRIIENFNKLNG